MKTSVVDERIGPVFRDAVVATARLIVEPPDPEDRTFSREFCEHLGRSIESEGLLQPPVVQEVDDPPDHYRVLAGRNRVYACVKILGWDHIPVRVARSGMDRDECKSIEIAENLWRNNLDPHQLRKALAEWERIYAARHPLAGGRGAHMIVGQMVKEAKDNGHPEAPPADDVEQKLRDEAVPFAKAIQDTLKVSRTTAGRLARAARNISPEQLDLLKVKEVTDKTIDAIAALNNPEAIERAIKLIASDMDHGEAVRCAAKPVRNAKFSRTPIIESTEAPPAKAKDLLTDDEWLQANCKVMLLATKNRKGPYRRDAILYRRVQDALVRFRMSVKAALKEARSSDGNGAFYATVYKVAYAKHPRDWLECSACGATGVDKEKEAAGGGKQMCQKCFAGGYKLQTDHP